MSSSLPPLGPGVRVAVSGVSHYQEAVRDTLIGDDVLLVHEVSNPHDRNAVRVTTMTGDVLGFVPRAGHINERLVAGSPGATWGGTVVDKLDGGDTTGLRVRITHRVCEGDATFGSDIKAVRDLDSAPPEVPASTTDGPSQHAPQVFTSTGRLLGTLVAVDANKVRVLTAAGSVVAYPEAVVRVDESAAA